MRPKLPWGERHRQPRIRHAGAGCEGHLCARTHQLWRRRRDKKRTDVPGQITGLFQHIRPAVKTAKGDLQKAIIENVRNQAILLAESSPVISKLVQEKKLLVAGGIYDLATGAVTSVDVTAS